ncbi:MAG TPA: sigma factor-like helix-turn-helix DNA-binding protein, partial [Candidatus Eisenbacteria bacterium]
AIDNPDHRRALSLRLFDDLQYQEVAAAMETPLNSVRAWIRRGRLALRRCLAARFEEISERP